MTRRLAPDDVVRRIDRAVPIEVTRDVVRRAKCGCQFRAVGNALIGFDNRRLRRGRFRIPVIVRTAKDWAKYIKENPFPDAAEKEPAFVQLALSKEKPAADAADRLAERCRDGERVVLAAGALWVHYRAGVGRSKLTPALFDKLAGSPVTSRSWKTVLKIQEMVNK